MSIRSFEQLVAELDRCEHGRHSIDPCYGCPGGQSTGNLLLPAGTKIGTTLYLHAIVVPARLPLGGDRPDDWHNPSAWVKVDW